MGKGNGHFSFTGLSLSIKAILILTQSVLKWLLDSFPACFVNDNADH